MWTKSRWEKQKGMTLLVALIMLVLLTLIVIASLNFGKGTLQAVGNMQHRNEVLGAAEEAFEEIISSRRFFEMPDDVFPTPCNGQLNTMCVDVNADGYSDVTVEVKPTPSCVRAQAIKSGSLDLSNKEDIGCIVGTQQNFGLGMLASGDSLCANSLWDVSAEATDATSEAKVVMTQGLAVRISSDNMLIDCP
jgi:Tfp pilus assembly protein PilX